MPSGAVEGSEEGFMSAGATAVMIAVSREAGLDSEGVKVQLVTGCSRYSQALSFLAVVRTVDAVWKSQVLEEPLKRSCVEGGRSEGRQH
jgi:hypothetical protein